MPLKDYFKLLEVPPNSTTAQIKKAFRKLAMQHHPDKQSQHDTNDSFFIEIQEAYETLINPTKREQYLYERWLNQTMGKTLEEKLQPHEILQLFIKTEQYLANTDKFRLNSYALYNQLIFVFEKARIKSILSSNNKDLIASANKIALHIAKLLNHECQIMFYELISDMIMADDTTSKAWDTLMTNTKKKEKIAILKIWILLIATILLCIGFLLMSKS